MSALPKAVAEELAKQEEAERRRARIDHAEEQQRARETRRLRREMEKESPAKPRAHLTLARNAAASEGKALPLLPQPENQTGDSKSVADAYQKLNDACTQLNEDARDFIFVLYWLMTAAGYSEKSRSFVVAILAYIDRRSSDFDLDGPEVRDAELSNFMGCSERTVQRRRKDYLREAERRLKILAVVEGDFDKETDRNQPTRYRFICDQIVGDAVVEARVSKLWKSDYREALKKAAFAAYDREERHRLGAIPPGIRRRRKRQFVPEKERLRLRNTMLTLASRLGEIESGLADDFSLEWEELKSHLEKNYRQASGFKEDDQGGRQTVAPSVPDVAVVAEMPVDAPVSEYMRVPSIARAVRDANSQTGG